MLLVYLFTGNFFKHHLMNLIWHEFWFHVVMIVVAAAVWLVNSSVVFRCHFLSAEQCQDWLRRINASVRSPARLEELFAFAFLSCSASASAEEREVHDGICRTGTNTHYVKCVDSKCFLYFKTLVFPLTGGHQHRFKSEMERMGFHTHSVWRISNINHNYRWHITNTLDTHTQTGSHVCVIMTRVCVCVCDVRLCSSYPERILVPADVTDQQLENVAAFRSWKRMPAVVYRCPFYILTSVYFISYLVPAFHLQINTNIIKD